MELVWQRHAVRNSRAFLKHVVPAVVKPARTLWNEVIGFLFICLAVVFGAATVRSYIDFTKAAPDAGGGFFLRVVMELRHLHRALLRDFVVPESAANFPVMSDRLGGPGEFPYT